ncbi:hypothetical protein AX15_003112 [Amanita polypyramis BW_CC]|nr:hypothetical protein AX15_003112 [Amanita polypyramis BW_CC]
MEPDTVELARFREQWKAEVLRKKDAVTASAGTTAQTAPSDPARVHPTALTATQKDLGPQRVTLSGKVHENTVVPSQNILSALQVYRNAICCEQNGELEGALLLYRQAFRMDPHVDRAYSREEKLAFVLASQQPPTRKDVAMVDTLVKDFSSSVSIGASKHAIAALTHIISKFPSDIIFMQEDEKQPLWLGLLPDELLVFVLRRLDVASIERFALVCRKARMLTLDATLWRELVIAAYKPPQLSQTVTLTANMERFGYNYRRMYIEQPRVRSDGVYIAICHYVRPGLSENHWVNISHLITYHRYLRFFPNGMVLSLLTNEEMKPQQIIPLLKPTLRMKGLFFGAWKLMGNTIHLDLVDAGERLHASLPPSLLSLLERLEVPEAPHAHRHASHGSYGHTNHTSIVAEQRSRYMFVMRLDLRSRPLGRWNRLDIESYNSVNLGTGDTAPFSLNHERPFWFSKVRSYST